ncbi:ribbon-helix-helix protein, CopG family [Mycolicibacter icosiumassiliensis]|uniref:ribbon-helix-helix protein, CopG family n=1 Tax=Mycolicibacter icosiumassiliensis TaxID=1792835 RepID=UPI000836A5D4|nr:ribbon-helix-helix protein, CopG family [Mycolicibacter icosiumassiliensis]
MALKKTTVMVDEDDLAVIKEAAARDGRPESEYFREAFHLAALRARRWSEDWDIPALSFGHPVTADEVHQVVAGAAGRTTE